MRKIRTPEEIAQDNGPSKTRFSLYLSVETMDKIKELGAKAGTSPSAIVDEAIRFYLAAIEEEK